jgi:5-methylthioadenosine/S-adenosylhomocysteine deaminase
VVTMDPDRRVLVGGAVAIAGSKILTVGATSELRRRWAGTPELDASGGLVTPGLINGHQHHTGDPLLRSCIPDDLKPGESIFSWSVPIHAEHGPEDDELAATLIAAECARNGITTVIEAGTVAHPERVAAGMAAVGVRGAIGTWGWDVEGVPFAAPAAEVLARQREVLDSFPPGGMITGWVTLVGHSLASDELLTGAAQLASERGTNMTMHMSPTRSDPEIYLERHGRRPIIHLDHLGVLGRHLLIAHGVWIDDTEADALLRTETAVAYCPWAYLRLGQGVTRQGRHADLFKAGGRIALGCDSSNAGDQADILRSAALAVGLAKDVREDPTWFSAADGFDMATCRGAEAVGLGDVVGSIEQGKQADIVVFDPSSVGCSPKGDTALALIWSADGRCVRDVLVAGRVVVRHGRCTGVDEQGARVEAEKQRRFLLERAGISVQNRWPHLDAR